MQSLRGAKNQRFSSIGIQPVRSWFVATVILWQGPLGSVLIVRQCVPIFFPRPTRLQFGPALAFLRIIRLKSRPLQYKLES